MVDYAEAFAPQTVWQRFEWGLTMALKAWAVGVTLLVSTLKLLAETGLIP